MTNKLDDKLSASASLSDQTMLAPDKSFDSVGEAETWADAQGYTEYGTEVCEQQVRECNCDCDCQTNDLDCTAPCCRIYPDGKCSQCGLGQCTRDVDNAPA